MVSVKVATIKIQILLMQKYKIFYSAKCLLVYEKRNKPLFWQQSFPREANVLVTVAKINVFF